jgi:hypothetical protein
MELVKPMLEYMISVGPMMIPYKSQMNQFDLTVFFMDKINEGNAFIVDANGALVIINPAPGLVMIVMTREQFEKNRGIQNLISKN